MTRIDKPRHGAHGLRCQSRLAQAANAGGVVAFGQPFSARIGEHGVVFVIGCGPAHQALQQHLHGGGRFQLDAPGDEGDALDRVVMRDAEMVAGGRVAPADHDIAR